MPELAVKLDSQPTLFNFKDVESYIKETHTEEIIIGLCGPIGSDVAFIAKSIQTIVETQYNYIGRIIKLSKFIKEQNEGVNYDALLKANTADYYNRLIDAGNKLRQDQKTGSVLAELAINEITVQRQISARENPATSLRRCYIIDSIKNQEELELFRLVYREIFYFIGVFTTLDNRQKNLTDKGLKIEDAIRLINRDAKEDEKFGQRVTDTFVEADFFLRLDKSTYNSVESKIKRFLSLIFSSDIKTPSTHENAMYLATAASGNSACLSRQVGAAITDENGEIISVGWNDVPKFGGGVYQFNEKDPTSVSDYRCMNLQDGICFNDKEKQNIANLLINELIKYEVIHPDKKAKLEEIIAASKISELIEFSRSVHAEMLAIIHGSQTTGEKMRGGRLYCTTYPCHNCARHIIAAGISEVYYIEPYRKSLAIKLHNDAITEDEGKDNRVRILMYEGVSPRRYLELFKMNSEQRKKDGKKTNLSTRDKKPKKTLTLQAIPILEKKITEDLINRKLIKASE